MGRGAPSTWAYIQLTSGRRRPTADAIVRWVKTILVVDDERHIVDLIRLYSSGKVSAVWRR
jgi:hypothetical protein